MMGSTVRVTSMTQVGIGERLQYYQSFQYKCCVGFQASPYMF